jgi:hypothetical protein
MMILFELILGLLGFGLVSLLSLIVIPSLLGCGGIMGLWLLVLGLLLIFSIKLSWLLITMLGVYLCLGLIKFYRYQSLPNYERYLTNRNVYLENQVQCCYCSSKQLVNRGLLGQRSKLRYWQCLQCKSWLYRFKVVG